MTLVVSDVSRLGIVMVGDSAASTAGGVGGGAVKIQYSAAANIGFALWGGARIENTYMDRWLAEFIKSEISRGESVEVVGQKLVAQLNGILNGSGRTWQEMKRGIHLAGYRGDIPVLFHIHSGHDPNAQHELELYRDYPDRMPMTDAQFRDFLTGPHMGFVHLRNGNYAYFAALFDKIEAFSAQLQAESIADFPYPGLEGRLDYYKTLVRFISGVLIASRADPNVNDVLSGIAFTANGIVENQILPFPASALAGGHMFSF